MTSIDKLYKLYNLCNCSTEEGDEGGKEEVNGKKNQHVCMFGKSRDFPNWEGDHKSPMLIDSDLYLALISSLSSSSLLQHAIYSTICYQTCRRPCHPEDSQCHSSECASSS